MDEKAKQKKADKINCCIYSEKLSHIARVSERKHLHQCSSAFTKVNLCCLNFALALCNSVASKQAELEWKENENERNEFFFVLPSSMCLKFTARKVKESIFFFIIIPVTFVESTKYKKHKQLFFLFFSKCKRSMKLTTKQETSFVKILCRFMYMLLCLQMYTIFACRFHMNLIYSTVSLPLYFQVS